MVKGIIKKGEYFDSVSLMIVSKEINKLSGVKDSSIVMGTNENKAILKMAQLFAADFDKADDTDLLIAADCENESVFAAVLSKVDELLKGIRTKGDDSNEIAPKTFAGAVKQMPEANLSLISVAGKYAAHEARKALNKGMHVMMFSDNVSIEDEISLKQLAVSKGLLMMGPDCGTAIINGIPLAFANVVKRGNIGIVAASGTGLQEVSSIISNLGGGISQAIGTGGRDVKKDVGGIMFLEAMKALAADVQTEVIVLVSKPPHETVIAKIAKEIGKTAKPVISILIGGKAELIEKAGAFAAKNLEEAAVAALAAAQKKDVNKAVAQLKERASTLKEIAGDLSRNSKGKYLRGLFSGGTLCDEAQLLLKDEIGYTYSNTPLNDKFVLKNIWKSEKHTIIDLGDDEFTAGRPHPMIDFSLRRKRIIEEAKDAETAIILLDVVLGYGSHLAPHEELVPAIAEAKNINPGIVIICSITGTDLDPQNKTSVKSALQNAGAYVAQSNNEAVELCKEILRIIR